jgi:hypothetical protein
MPVELEYGNPANIGRAKSTHGSEWMDIAGVREALHRLPFEPFEIRLADGRALPVSHPDFVALGTRRIVVVNENDQTSIIEPLLIVSLDSMPNRGRSGNGTSKRKRRC